MSMHEEPAGSTAQWRRFGRFLWAGADETGPIGTVERGWRFLAVDTTGAVLGRCRSLEDAQSMLEHVAPAERNVGVPSGLGRVA